MIEREKLSYSHKHPYGFLLSCGAAVEAFIVFPFVLDHFSFSDSGE
jgi:hypothetical protein